MRLPMAPEARPASEVTPVPVSPWLIRLARLRVTGGFLVAVLAYWLARPSWTSLLVGAGIALLGEGLRFWAAGHLEKATEVTVSGPYRWMRHPLYVGSSILGLGVAVSSRVPIVAALVTAYLVVSLSVAARLEEATLRAKFPGDYDRYAEGTVRGDRPFSFARARRNGELQTVLGLLAALALMALRIPAI